MDKRDAHYLLKQIIALSGLAPTIAGPVIRRVFVRLNMDPESITTADLARALDSLEKALRLYLTPDDASRRIAALRELIR